MKQLSKVLVIAASLVALLLAALPAFAMRIESESLPVKPVSVRRDGAVAAQPVVALPAAAQPGAAQPAAVQSVAVAAPAAATVSVYAGPSAPVEAAPVTIEPITLEPADFASVKIGVVSHETGTQGSEIEFKGVIDSLTGVSPTLVLSVTGYVVTTTEQTRFRGAIEVGSYVEVEGYLQPDGSVWAKKVSIEDQYDDQHEVEFKGTIDSLTGISPTLVLSVTGRVVTTTAETKFRGVIEVGAYVEVEGYLQPDGGVLAKKVAVEHQDDHDHKVEFRGPIMALPADVNWLGEWVVGEYTVTVDVSTTLDTHHGQIALGAIAEVKAYRQADGSLLAIRIKIKDNDDFEHEHEFEGLVSNLTGTDPYTFTVNGITVTTDAQTQISGTLANGVKVEVHGAQQADGSVLATRIEVEDDHDANHEQEFKATITALPAGGLIGEWQFSNGVTVTVDAATVINQSHGAAEVGVRVEVKALLQADGTWLAVRIKVENE